MNAKPILALSLFAAMLVHADRPRSMDVTVQVFDELGKPIPMSYILGGSEGGNRVAKRTDERGEAVFRDAARTVYFNPEVICPGYYKSWGDFVVNVVQPGNMREYVVVLRKVINPVPIETEEMRFLIGRKFDEDIGFDLEKLDWTPPHGAGVHTDLVVRASWEKVADDSDGRLAPVPGLRSTVSLRVVGEGNGFLPFRAIHMHSAADPGSIFMPPHQVPLTGLTNKIFIVWETFDNLLTRYTEEPGMHYAFRVRSTFDQQGVLSSAHVGWIEGQIAAGADLPLKAIPTPPDQSLAKRFPTALV